MGISQTDETSGIISYSPKGYSVFVHAFQLGGIWNVFNDDKKKLIYSHSKSGYITDNKY